MDSTAISLLSFLISLEFLAFVGLAFLLNHSIILVPQNSVSVVERFRKFQSSLQPGLNFVMPFIDKVVANRSLKEQLIHIPQQSALTKDNISITAEGILHYKVLNPYESTYSVEDYITSLTKLAQAAFRSELSKLELYDSHKIPENLNSNVIETLNEVSNTWGILVIGYEIKELSLPTGILEEMESRMRKSLRAARDKEALIIESEGKKQAQILEAEAEKVVNTINLGGDKSESNLQGKVEDLFAQRQ